MDQFRTPVLLPDFPEKISHTQRLIGLGSCFIEHIGQRLHALKYVWEENPFGIVYNPLSMASGIRRLLSGALIQVEDLFLHQELWHSWDFHSRYSHPDRDLALEGMNAAIHRAGERLRCADWIVLTFGTAFVYRLVSDDRVVSNCHKVPGTFFERHLPNLESLLTDWEMLLAELRAVNPGIKILVTVSPVRHKSDGFVDNQRSKARLHLLAEHLCRNEEQVYYFPAYEIMMDELRDYRFYATDMIHPGEQAISYIWSRFEEGLMRAETRALNKAIGSLLAGLSHRPFFPETEAHRKHWDKLRQRWLELAALLPEADWSAERIRLG